MKTSLKPGDRLHGFVVNEVHDLPEYRATGIICTHEVTGCNVYHVYTDDPDKLFAFGFKTLPEDSSGVAHILEHTVLCGSERFPVKDPFLLLLKGSMNTFLNAFTFPDKTVYPASSTVEKDLFNLMEVYGDAVFFPLLKPEMFRQEGHRLEFDDNGVLVRTGIVFNEMKGNYSTHDSVAGDWCMRSLFPDTAYGHDSGGDPAHIPELTYQAFKAFHDRYYHPSNTRIFLYGDMDAATWLEFMQQRFLSRFTRLELDVEHTDPAPFTAPVRVVKTYPAAPEDEENGKASITVNWLLNHVQDAETTLALELLSEILIGSAASPLQRALVDSGLGEDLSGTTGLETELSRVTLSLGLRGTEQGREDAIEKLIFDTLKQVVLQGLNPELVEGTLRRFEFRGKEIKGGGPFGLRLMRRAFRGWLHGASPETTMVFDPLMKAVRARLKKEPRWFEGLVQSMLIDNMHRSTVTIIPDGEQNVREQDAERAALDAIQSGLSAADKTRIETEQHALKTYQETPDDPVSIAKIPFLSEADIPLEVSVIPAEDRVIMLGDTVVPVQVHDLYTNGISYIDLCFDIEHLESDDLFWMPLYAGLVPGLGIPGSNYEETAKQLNLLTGGFSSFIEASLQARSSEKDPEDLHIKLYYRLKCLESGVNEAMELAGRLVTEADFSDLKRVSDQYMEMRNEYRSAIVPSGSGFASLRAERSLSQSEAIEENWRGISQQQFLETLTHDGKVDGEGIARALEALRARIIRREGLTVNISAGGNALEDALQVVTKWSTVLPSLDITEEADLASRPDKNLATDIPRLEALTLPSKVAFVATSMTASLIGESGYSHESLLSHLLKTGFLWENVRMKGGAYGASAGNDGMSGIFTFSSYRDPNIVRTLNVWREALQFFADNPVGAEELLLAKIGTVAREIRPLVPAEAGMVAFRRWMYGISDEMRQKKRNELMRTQPKDLSAAAKRLLSALEDSYSVVIAGPEMVDKEAHAHPDFTPVRKQLSV